MMRLTVSQRFDGAAVLRHVLCMFLAAVLFSVADHADAQVSLTTGTSSNGGAFGQVTVTQAKDITFTVANDAAVSTTYTISISPAASDFSILTTTCSVSVSAGKTCVLIVRYLPTTTGAATAYLTVLPGAAGVSGAVFELSGTGTTFAKSGVLTINPKTLDFGAVAPGSKVYKSVSLTASDADVTNLSKTLPAGYTIFSDGCGKTVVVGRSCSLTVEFAPSASATYNGYMTLSSSAGTDYIDLTGGAASGGSVAALTVSPTSLAFGSLAVGKSSTQQVTLSASGGDVTSIAPTVPEGYQVVANACGATLPSGRSCSMSITFSPTVKTNYLGFMTVSSSAGSKYVDLSGDGGTGATGGTTGGTSTAPAQLTLDLSSHDFGNATLGEVRSFKFVLSNIGGVGLSNSVYLDGAGFAIVPGGCYTGSGVSIAGRSSCDFTVNFAPTASGNYQGSVQFGGTGSGNAIIRLTGTATGGGVQAGGGGVTAMTSTLDFGQIATGSQATRSVSLLANTTGVALVGIYPPSGYSVTHDCDGKLGSAGYCTVNVTFSPGASQVYDGFMTLITNSGASTFIAVTGRGGAQTGASQASFSATQAGSTTAQTITGSYRFAEQGAPRSGNLYAAMVYGSDVYFISSGSKLTPYVPGFEPPVYASGVYQATDITLFLAQDLSRYSGAQIYLGYGSSIQDMLQNRQFGLVYTLP